MVIFIRYAYLKCLLSEGKARDQDLNDKQYEELYEEINEWVNKHDGRVVIEIPRQNSDRQKITEKEKNIKEQQEKFKKLQEVIERQQKIIKKQEEFIETQKKYMRKMTEGIAEDKQLRIRLHEEPRIIAEKIS